MTDSGQTHEQWETRHERLRAEQRELRVEAARADQAAHQHAWAAAVATFWQTIGGTSLPALVAGQAASWGDLGQQVAGLGLSLAAMLVSAVVAGGLAYARWRGGTPPAYAE